LEPGISAIGGPIQQVMDFLCLSAAGVRFLDLPFPLRDCTFLAVGLLPEADLIGVSTFRTREM
jgi:hypothetical protein